MTEFTDYPKEGQGEELDPLAQPESYPGFSDVPESARESLKLILERITTVDEPYRYRQLRGLKRNNLFWMGITNLVWSGGDSTGGDWFSISDAVHRLGSDDLKIDPSLYDETVAIYRAYGEAIIGAAFSAVPSVRFFPQNAEIIDDIRTSACYSRIAKKIQQENKCEVLMSEIGKTMCNEGLVGIYNYSHFDKKYGSVSRDVYGSTAMEVTNIFCPNCQSLVESDAKEIEEKSEDLGRDTVQTDEEVLQAPLKDEFGADGMIAAADPTQLSAPDPSQEIKQCPNCGFIGPMPPENYQEDQPVKKGQKEFDKARQILEVYGASQIQISQFADKPQDIGYLILYSEAHYAKAKSLFPWIKDKIVPGDDLGNYYRWSRQYTGSFDDSSSQCTIRRCWFEPWMYETITDEEKRAELYGLFPKGTYAVFVNDHFAQAFDECKDDHWTLSLHPLSSRIYSDPLLKFTVPIQTMIDDVVSLTLQTIKFGVSPVFADPRYFDFDKWGSTQALPGAFYPMSSPTGKSLSDAFATIKPANLSKEIDSFMSRLDFFGQLVSGAFPSIYGGADASTLGQDNLNKQQALQRLGIAWTVVKNMWASVLSKAVKNYAENLLEDEITTEKIGNSYINSVIRLEDLAGKIGEVYPEADEQFPQTWGQKRASLFQLIELNNPGILALLGNPENVGPVARLIGLDDLYVPGDDQRNKQLDEISELIVTQPMLGPLGQPISSVQIEPEVDDSNIHITTCQAFLASELGMDLKRFNPGGYANVVAHLTEHQLYVQQQMMLAQQQQAAMNPAPEQAPGQEVAPVQ